VSGPDAHFMDLVSQEHQIHTSFRCCHFEVVASFAGSGNDTPVVLLDFKADLMTVYLGFVFHSSSGAALRVIVAVRAAPRASSGSLPNVAAKTRPGALKPLCAAPP